MAIPSGDDLRRHCNNLDRAIEDMRAQTRATDELVRQFEQEIRDLQNRIQDPTIEAWLKREIRNDIQRLATERSKHESDSQKLRQKLEDFENHFAVDCSGF